MHRIRLLAALLPASVLASPVVARLSPSGVAFVEEQAPSLVPPRLAVDDLSLDLWSCDGDPARIVQAGTQVDLSIAELKISLPAAGRLRVDVTLSATAVGEARLEKIYACYGREVCQDRLALRGAHAAIEFSARIVGGQPKIEFQSVQLDIDREDVDMELSGCNPAELVTGVLNGVKDIGLDVGVWALERIARDKLGPLLSQAVAGFMTYRGVLDIYAFSVTLSALELGTRGITVAADADVSSPFPPASCLGGSLPAEPGASPGPAPDLAAAPASDVAVAVNLGVVQDVVYHLWRSGFLCLGPGSFAGLDLDLGPELEKLAHLPGLPEGTRLALEIDAAQPPTVQAGHSDPGKLTVRLIGIGLDLRAVYPDDTGGNLHLDIDASATASIAIDPMINAVVLSVDRVAIDRLAARDGLGLTEYGFDAGRIRRMLEDKMFPKVGEMVGKVPLTGPVFGGILDTYVVLRAVQTTPSFVVAKGDLFRAPAGDTVSPTTRIESRPLAPVRPATARVVASGSDDKIPAELLRYRVSVDGGAAGEPTFVNSFPVGEEGKTQTYRVLVKAVDLAGNEDATGAMAEVQVDGIAPLLTVTTQLRGTLETTHPTFSWTASDDTSSTDRMASRLEVFHQPEHAGGEFEETLVDEESFSGGAHSLELTGFQPGKQYRVVATVTDEAGNADSASFIFLVSADAGSGCNVGGSGGGWMVALVLLAIARRRTRTRSSPTWWPSGRSRSASVWRWAPAPAPSGGWWWGRGCAWPPSAWSWASPSRWRSDRSMAELLYQVRPRDSVTLGLVAAVLVATAALACYLPSRRATRVDPMVALRTA